MDGKWRHTLPFAVKCFSWISVTDLSAVLHRFQWPFVLAEAKYAAKPYLKTSTIDHRIGLFSLGPLDKSMCLFAIQKGISLRPRLAINGPCHQIYSYWNHARHLRPGASFTFKREQSPSHIWLACQDLAMPAKAKAAKGKGQGKEVRDAHHQPLDGCLSTINATPASHARLN